MNVTFDTNNHGVSRKAIQLIEFIKALEAMKSKDLKLSINDAIYERIEAGTIKKGDVLSVAQLAAIMGAKQTSNLIPLCHPLALTKVEVHCTLVDGESPACTDATHNRAVKVRATVKTTGKTGVEMEALTAVQVGLLTVYDMCKAIDKGMIIGPTYLVEKEGGKSGHFVKV